MWPTPAMTLGGLAVDGESGQLVRADGAGLVEGVFAAGRTAVGVCSFTTTKTEPLLVSISPPHCQALLVRGAAPERACRSKPESSRNSSSALITSLLATFVEA